MTRRPGIMIAIAILAAVLGFFFLLRSCLSQFDERSAVGGGSSSASQFLVFEKDGKGVIFSLVKFDKTVSYSQKGGMTNKSVYTTYYAQANDLVTAAKTASQKIKTHTQVKAYPVEILGAAGNQAWLFVGELMAYDPFTLNKTADAAIIESKNPGLKGKLIQERRYYDFDHDTKQIIITAADGEKYILNTSTLTATLADDDQLTTDEADKRIKELDLLTKKARDEQQAAYEKLRENNRQYREKQISQSQYLKNDALLSKEPDRIGKQLDSLQSLLRDTRENKNMNDDVKRTKEGVRRRGSGYSGMKVNCDTLDGRWYGLYSPDEIQKTGNRFRYESGNDETARNRLYTSTLSFNNKEWIIGDEKKKSGETVYLQGGFLLDKETGIPVHLPDGFLVINKDIIGNDGKVQLSRIRLNSETVWTLNTGLKDFYDWQLQNNKLLVTGTDNKKLSSGEVNLLMVIDLATGKTAGYDFFADKVR